MNAFVVQAVCNRCGFITESKLVLSNKEDNAVYRCGNCNFIVFSSWMEGEEMSSP